MDTSLLTLAQLIERHHRRLSIPPYQRRYVWGRTRPGEKDAAEYLAECLVGAYRRGRGYFLQGVTLTADGQIVDGQQRLTCLCLLLRCLGAESFTIDYPSRPEAQAWMEHPGDVDSEASQDVYLFRKTMLTVESVLSTGGLNRAQLARHILDNVTFLYMQVDTADAVAVYTMMNGTKSPMAAADLIKADLMRHACDERQPAASDWDLSALSARYAAEWEDWWHWWCRTDVRAYYDGCLHSGIDLLLALCLCHDPEAPEAWRRPLTYETFRQLILNSGEKNYHTAKHFFDRLRRTQKRFEQAFADPGSYNRVRAVLLLQNPASRFRFLHAMMVTADIDTDELDRYYRLSFLGMSVDEIAAHAPEDEYLEDLYASLSTADVYHGDAKRDVFNLLLRLNIDEDNKLGRRFDFSVWQNRSLEHIFSKSKVWHLDCEGRVCDGNDNEIRLPLRRIQADPSYIARESIVSRDGVHLTEHCIGNLVLLYGQNNAEFGNVGFEEKKRMFLSPGDRTVFRSRNLLHSVCVFAGEAWTADSIVQHYHQTLRDLKQYYATPAQK